jgi:7,8-dihydroneopterin aldolase/epimerase/oxygenase
VTLLEISGLELFGRHGALEEERRYGRKFLFDLRLEVGEQASRSDRLEDAVDYRDVVTLVKAVSDGRQYTLLEALARAMAEAVLRQFPAVKQVHVRVRKVGAQLGAPVEWTGASVDLGN